MDEKIKVCAYCRVSTASKDQENSYENQLRYFQEKTHDLGNYKLVEIYADKGLSATSMKKRKDFLRMIHDAGIDIVNYSYKYEKKEKLELVLALSDRKPKFNKILVKNTSRFARNIEVISLVRKLREKKVYVEFLDKNISTEDSKNDLVINMFLSVDERESKEKSDRVRFGQKAGMEKGVIMANGKLFGYNKKNKYTLEIVKKEAKIINFIFEQYANGLGIRRIINLLNQNKYKTREGKAFVKSTINKILQNEKYKGWLVRNKYYTGTLFVDKTVTPKINPKEEWIVHKEAIPAIVSEELWDKCQSIREKKVNYEKQKGIYNGISEYRGKIYCSKCGHSYTKNKDRGRTFFNCGLKKVKGIKECDNINISEDKLSRILDILGRKLYYEHIENNIAFIRGKLEEELYEYKTILNKEIDLNEMKILEEELKKIQEQEKRLLDLYLDDISISKTVLDDKVKKLHQNKNRIQEKNNQLSRNREELEKYIREIEEDIESLHDYLLKEQFTKDELLNNEIDKIEVINPREYFSMKFKSDDKEIKNKQNNKTNIIDKKVEGKDDVKRGFGGDDAAYDSAFQKENNNEIQEFFKVLSAKNNIMLKIRFKGVAFSITIGITKDNNIFHNAFGMWQYIEFIQKKV